MVGFIEAVPVEIEQAAISTVVRSSCTRARRRAADPAGHRRDRDPRLYRFVEQFPIRLVLSNDATKTLPVAVLSYIGYTQSSGLADGRRLDDHLPCWRWRCACSATSFADLSAAPLRMIQSPAGYIRLTATSRRQRILG